MTSLERTDNKIQRLILPAKRVLIEVKFAEPPWRFDHLRVACWLMNWRERFQHIWHWHLSWRDRVHLLLDGRVWLTYTALNEPPAGNKLC